MLSSIMETPTTGQPAYSVMATVDVTSCVSALHVAPGYRWRQSSTEVVISFEVAGMVSHDEARVRRSHSRALHWSCRLSWLQLRSEICDSPTTRTYHAHRHSHHMLLVGLSHCCCMACVTFPSHGLPMRTVIHNLWSSQNLS